MFVRLRKSNDKYVIASTKDMTEPYIYPAWKTILLKIMTKLFD